MRPISALLLCSVLAACGSAPPRPPIPVAAPVAAPAPEPAAAAPALPEGDKPIFQMTPTEVNRFIADIHRSEPDLRKRIAAIGRRNIGQPYLLNLLGEFPYEVHDGLPMFSLAQSDCVVFAEHTYAMALSASWEEFFWMLQRIRYKDGVIGVANRNHYTEVDWNLNNSWLVTDISTMLGDASPAYYPLKVDRARFLKVRHGTERSIPVQLSREAYVPKESLAAALAQLQDGDLVNVISTRDGAYWASHVGLVVTGANGERNFLNSAEPAVREESFDAFLARTAEREAKFPRGSKLAGFKFLRLNDNIVVPPALPQPRPGT